MIEFNKCTVGGKKYIAVTVDNRTKALIDNDGNRLTIIAQRDLTEEETLQVYKKMKELSEVSRNSKGLS